MRDEDDGTSYASGTVQGGNPMTVPGDDSPKASPKKLAFFFGLIEAIEGLALGNS